MVEKLRWSGFAGLDFGTEEQRMENGGWPFAHSQLRVLSASAVCPLPFLQCAWWDNSQYLLTASPGDGTKNAVQCHVIYSLADRCRDFTHSTTQKKQRKNILASNVPLSPYDPQFFVKIATMMWSETRSGPLIRRWIAVLADIISVRTRNRVEPPQHGESTKTSGTCRINGSTPKSPLIRRTVLADYYDPP